MPRVTRIAPAIIILFLFNTLACAEDSTLSTFNQGNFRFDANTFRVDVPYTDVPTHDIYALDIVLTRNPVTLFWELDGFRTTPRDSVSDTISGLSTTGFYNAFSGTLYVPVVCDSATQETCFNEVYFDTVGFPGSNVYALRAATSGDGLCGTLAGDWNVNGSVQSTLSVSGISESQTQSFDVNESTNLSINGNRVRFSTSGGEITGTCSIENGVTLIEIDALDLIKQIEDGINQDGTQATVSGSFTEKITVNSSNNLKQTGTTTINIITTGFTQTLKNTSNLSYTR